MKRSEALKEMKKELEAREAEISNAIHERILAGADLKTIDFTEADKLRDKINDLRNDIAIEERREVEVGDGVTLRYFTDCEAYTVIKRTKATITIQRDKATLDPNFKPKFIPGGFVAHCTNQNEQTYTYERDPNGTIKTAHWSEKNGRFMVDGELRIFNGRKEFYDYNF